MNTQTGSAAQRYAPLHAHGQNGLSPSPPPEYHVTETITRQNEPLRRRTGLWVLSIGFAGLVFDGYDLVVYGTVVSTLLRDPHWALKPA
jgi:hypothetical protein